jgi:hypothetical protein
MGKMRRGLTAGLAAISGIVVLLAWDCCGWSPVPQIAGRMAAERDMRHGIYRVLGYGLANPERSVYAQEIKNRYGVEFRAIAGCIVTKARADYVDAYDAVSEGAIRQRFGRDVLRETAERMSKAGPSIATNR